MEEISSNGKRIRHNFRELSQNTTNIGSLMDYLFSKKIISLHQKQTFMSGNSDEEKCSNLYKSLMKVVSNTVFQQLIDVLKETGNQHLADVLLHPEKSSEFQRGLGQDSRSFPCSKLPKWWPKQQTLIKSLIPRQTGKLLIVEKLKQLLIGNEDNTCVLGQKATVAGMGGIGKTTTAKWFADYYKSEYDHIIWLDCGEGNTEKSLRQLAAEMEIKLKTEDEEKRATQLVVEDVYFVLKSAQCLFIFDNVDHYKDAQGFLPTSGNNYHHCLITSRYQSWGNETDWGRIEVFQLGVFSEDDAAEFFRSALKNKNQEGNEVEMRHKLAEAMGNLPLALNIAVSTINNLGWSISEYLQHLENCEQIPFNGETDSDQMSLKRSLEMSIRVIEENASIKLAEDIMNVFAFIAPNDVQKYMLAGIFQGDKKYDIDTGLTFLQDNSLVNRSEVNGEVYTIHRLLQDVVRMKIPDVHLQTVLRKLLTYFDRVFHHFNNDHSGRNHIASVWGHAMKYDSLVDSFSEFFLDFVEYTLLASNRLQLLQAVVPQLDRVFGNSHLITCKARFHVGHILFQSMQYVDCCNIWESILEVLSKSEIELILSVQFNLGVINEKLKIFVKAVQFYDNVANAIQNRSHNGDSNPFGIKLRDSILDCDITSTSKGLYDDFPLRIELQCKIICLQVTLKFLKNAWQRMQFVVSDSHAEDQSREFNSKSCIIVAGFKLLIALSKSESGIPDKTIKEQYELFHFLCKKFTEWSLEEVGFLLPVYWNALAGVADLICKGLLKIEMFDECINVYELLLNVYKFIPIFDFEASTQFSCQSLGLEVIQRLEGLNRNYEAGRVRVLTDLIKNVLLGNFLGAQPSKYVEIEHDIATTVTIKGKSKDELIHFTAFQSSVNPGSVMEISMKYVKFCKYDLLLALNACPNLAKLSMKDVSLIGGCKGRVHLPKLMEFHIRLVDSYVWRELIGEHGVTSVVSSLLFIYKNEKKRNWELKDCGHLGLDKLSICVPYNSINIDSVGFSVKCCLLDYNVNEILQSVNFFPWSLKLDSCEMSMESILQLCSGLKHLTLIHVALDERGDELSHSLRNRFTHLEELNIFGDTETKMSINFDNLPLALKKLKLSNINIIAITNDDNGSVQEYESLLQLTLIRVTFKVADEIGIEISNCVSEYFPHLEELCISVDSSTRISININNLGLKLRNLELSNIDITEFSIGENGLRKKYETLTQLTLKEVHFPAAGKREIELSDFLMQHFPYLQKLFLSASNFTPISININSLPKKLIQLKLKNIAILRLLINENRSRTEYESLTELTLKDVTFPAEYESVMELGDVLLQHFPYLEKLCVFVRNTTATSINIHNLSLNLKHLSLYNTKLVYHVKSRNSLSAQKTQLQSISLENVSLSKEESEVFQLFGTTHTITIDGYSGDTDPTVSLLKKLIEISSVQEINITNLDWTSDNTSECNTEFINWLEQVGVPLYTDYFCLERISNANQQWRAKYNISSTQFTVGWGCHCY